MATNVIKQVSLDSGVYEINAKYIQNASGEAKQWADIVDLVSSAKVKIVVVESLPEPAEQEHLGAIYLVAEEGVASGSYVEYIAVEDASSSSGYSWERIGTTAADLTDYVKKATNYSGAAQSGGAHTHSVSGNVTVPSITKTESKISASASQGSVSAPTSAALTGLGTPTTDKALGEDATFTTTVTPSMAHIKASANTTSLKGVSGTTTVPSSVSATAGTKGSAASWGATVSNGVLSFNWTTNTPTTPTAVTVGADATVATANASATTVVTGVGLATEASSSDSTITVATGITSSTTTVNTKDSVTAITGITPSSSNFVTGVTVGDPTVTLASGTTGDLNFVASLSVGTASAALQGGTAASAGAHTHDVNVAK